MAEKGLDFSKLDAIYRESGKDIGLIPFLQKAQDTYGYLPPDVLERIADKLFLPVSQVYGVATFYTQFHFQPRGRHLIQQCDGTACHVNGAREIIAKVCRRYGIKPGETTEDLMFTFELVYCLGCCAIGPAAIIDREIVGHLTPEKMLGIIARLDEQPEDETIPKEWLLEMEPPLVVEVPWAPVDLRH